MNNELEGAWNKTVVYFNVVPQYWIVGTAKTAGYRGSVLSRFDPRTSATQSRFRAIPNQDTNSWRLLYCLSAGISHCSGRRRAKNFRMNSWMSGRFVRHPSKSRRPHCHVLCGDDILTDWVRKESCSWSNLDLTSRTSFTSQENSAGAWADCQHKTACPSL